MVVEDKARSVKRERQESVDEGNSTASTLGGENDSSSSVGQHSDSETPRKNVPCDDEASEAACSLASIMMSIQQGKRAGKLQPER